VVRSRLLLPANSVSLVETFARPLVIGYLGFDMPILDNGDLGPPIPTHAILERRDRPQIRSMSLARDQNSQILEDAVLKREGGLRAKVDACRKGQGLADVELSDFIQDPRYATERHACVRQLFGRAAQPNGTASQSK
jgi:hypothetical protein